MNFEFMTIDTPLPPCMPFPRALTGFPVSSTAKVMYCRMLDAMLSKGQEDENGILFVCFPVTAIEQKLFLQQLHEMDSYYVNEHIVNLLLEVRGNLRTEKQEMLSTIDRFLTLPPDERLLFTVGRRLNIFFRLDDLKKPKLHQKAGESLQQILSKNPHVDFAALCNYVRQSQI